MARVVRPIRVAAINMMAERVLNRMNQAGERIFVQDLTARAAAWAESGAAGLVQVLLVPLWNLMRLSDQRRKQLDEKLGGLIRNGVVPLGISVAAVVFLLTGLYFVL